MIRKKKNAGRMKDTGREKSLQKPFKPRLKDTGRNKFLLKPFETGSKGDLIAGALSVAIIVASTIIVINAITPTIQQSQSIQSFNDAKQILTSIDSTINEVMTEAPGSRRSMGVNLQKGKLTINGKEDTIKITIDNVDIVQAGLTVEDSNILVSGGAKINSYEKDANNDGNTDLVLENAAVIFAIQKIGSPSSYASINTTTMITQIKNARTGINVTPTSGIFINDLDNSSYGNGFSELTQVSDASSKGIRVFVNSTSGLQYEALFTLQAAKDSVDLQVKRIK